MIQTFIHIILISLVCITWGLPILILLPSLATKQSFWFNSFTGLLAFLFFGGCITLSFLCGWLVLFAPLNFDTLVIITVVGGAYLLFFKRDLISQSFKKIRERSQPTSFTNTFYIGISLLLFITLGALKPVNIDTQIYHLQIIKWLSQYGVVPGIANLSPRFGLASGWFNLISMLHIPLFKHQHFSYLNAAFVSWTFLWLFEKFNFHRKDNSPSGNTFSLYYFLLSIYFMLDWQLFRDAANSTNYDFPVNAFTVILISLVLEELIKKKVLENQTYLFLFFAFTIISLKFSGVFIIFLTIYYLLQKGVKGYFFSFLVFGILILLPVFIKNYIITGYPLYPLPLSIDNPDWQLPVQLTKGIYRYILNSNRFYNSPFTAELMESSPFYWFPIWFKGILIQHKIIFLASIISVILLLFRKPIPWLDNKRLKSLTLILLIMIAGWFFTAPDPGRFGYGVLLPTSFFCFALFTHKLASPAFYTISLILLSLVLSYYTYQKTFYLTKGPKFLLEPVTWDQTPFKTIYKKGMGIHIPEIINSNQSRRCYDIDLPCTCEENPYLQPRGNSLQKGFRMYPQPDSMFIKNYIY